MYKWNIAWYDHSWNSRKSTSTSSEFMDIPRFFVTLLQMAPVQIWLNLEGGKVSTSPCFGAPRLQNCPLCHALGVTATLPGFRSFQVTCMCNPCPCNAPSSALVSSFRSETMRRHIDCLHVGVNGHDLLYHILYDRCSSPHLFACSLAWLQHAVMLVTTVRMKTPPVMWKHMSCL